MNSSASKEKQNAQHAAVAKQCPEDTSIDGELKAGESEKKPAEGGSPHPPPVVPVSMLPRGPIAVALPKSPGSSAPARPYPNNLPARPTTQMGSGNLPGANNNKKRKLSTSVGSTAPSSSSAASFQAQPRPSTTAGGTKLTDPKAIKTANNMLGLLQKYGPLTFRQLEFNLPAYSSLSDILHLLVATGVVQVVKGSVPPRYVTLHGKVRADVVLPSEVLDEILDAQEEVKESLERAETLKKALLENDDPKKILERLLSKYPDIAKDPVYLAAFRNVNVDVASVRQNNERGGGLIKPTGKKQSKAMNDVKSGAQKTKVGDWAAATKTL
jgi:hypothetical protein